MASVSPSRQSPAQAKAHDPRLPRYLQVKDELMRRIADRIWKAGDALPSEDKLAVEFEISVGTMRKALDLLVQETVIERIHGRGTFVTRAFERASMLRFVRFRSASSDQVPTATILKIRVEEASALVKEKLGLSGSDKVIYMHRTRSFEDELVLVEHIWLPHKRFARLPRYLEKESPPLLYPVYDAICGVAISRAVDDLSVSPFPDVDATLFKVPKKTMAMKIERTMYEHSGQPVEWRTSYMPAERFHYTAEIR